MSTVDRRYAVISELLRITKPGGVVMIQAWALEQGSDSKRTFESQDTMVPWRLSKRFLTEEQQRELLGGDGAAVANLTQSKDGAEAAVDTSQTTAGSPPTAAEAATSSPTPAMEARDAVVSSDSGRCQHVVEDSGELVFQRYCHVYKEGELEGLCSSIPGCEVIESGWDKGNWFVQLRKVSDERLTSLPVGPDSRIPVLAPRSNNSANP